MNISGPFKNIVFSRDKNDVVASDIAYPSTFKVKFIDDLGNEYGFPAKPYLGKYTLHLDEVLKAFEESTIAPDVPDGGYVAIAPRLLTIEFSETPDLTSTPDVHSCAIKWMPGYCNMGSDDRNRLLSGIYWWTLRPQSALTLKWSREILQTAIKSSDSEDSVKIVIDLHFAEKEKQRMAYLTIPRQADNTFAAIDVSYSSIEKAALKAGITDQIIAYDVIGITDKFIDRPIGQRFVVVPMDRYIRAWYFRNSLGAFDTVYSFGEVTRSIESEAKTFTVGGKELEISNISKDVYSVDTGYIKNEKELNLWYEFLRSVERYIISEDGKYHRIVVDSSDSKKTLNEAGSISFKCRMSEELEGYAFPKSRLEDFSNEFT